jgi:uncharacterized protein (TIGR03086 family)
MTDAPVTRLAQALSITGGLVAGVGAGQWGAPTPCAGWTVRDLVNHVVVGHRAFAMLLRGEPPAEVRKLRSSDQLGAGPVAAYRESGADLLAAFGQPGVMERMVTLPIGEVPGLVALHLRLVEALVHGWDLSRATTQPLPAYPAGLAEQELDFTLAKLSDIPPGHSPFGPPQPAPENAPALDRLAARLGRSLSWRPTTS